MSLENVQQSPIDLAEARDLMMRPVEEELDKNDPLFNMKYKNMVERRQKEESVRTALFQKVLDNTATDDEKALVAEVVKDRPYYVRGHADLMENPVFAKALQEADQEETA